MQTSCFSASSWGFRMTYPYSLLAQEVVFTCSRFRSLFDFLIFLLYLFAAVVFIMVFSPSSIDWADEGQETCAGVGSVAPGPTNLCWCGCGGSRASKPVLVWARWLQGQQTCDGAYERSLQFERTWSVDAKLIFQVAYQTISQLACSLIDLNLPSTTYHPA